MSTNEFNIQMAKLGSMPSRERRSTVVEDLVMINVPHTYASDLSINSLKLNALDSVPINIFKNVLQKRNEEEKKKLLYPLFFCSNLHHHYIVMKYNVNNIRHNNNTYQFDINRDGDGAEIIVTIKVTYNTDKFVITIVRGKSVDRKEFEDICNELKTYLFGKSTVSGSDGGYHRRTRRKQSSSRKRSHRKAKSRRSRT